MSKAFSVSVVTPVFNEEEIIESAVNTNLRLLRQYGCDFEILLVNDGSTDGSARIIDRCFSDIPSIRIIHMPANEGFGGAVRRGIAAAGKEYILCIPADSPLTDEVLASFLAAAGKADIIVSYRLERLGYTPRMKLNSKVFHFIVSALFDMHLRDFNWIHMYHRRIFADNGIGIRSKSLFMLAEVLISAKRKGYTFFEIPVHQTQRLTGIATASKFTTVMKTLRDIAVYYFKGSKLNSEA